MRHLTIDDRIVIQKLKKQFTISKIADLLDFSKSTISREIKRNGIGTFYNARDAQEKYSSRRVKQGKKYLLELKNIVLDTFLCEQWSPEQICNRLKLEHPSDSNHSVSHETVYQWIYREIANGDERYVEYFRIKRKKRKKRFDKAYKSLLEVLKKNIRELKILKTDGVGHLQGDTVHSIQGDKTALITYTDVYSKYLFCAKVEDKTSENFAKKSIELLSTMNKDILSITLDNGSEMNKFQLIEKALNTSVYFCDPGNPGQRGLNENTNGLLRQYFPKKSLSEIKESDLQEAVDKINNRPRKSLGYLTPYEVHHNKKMLRFKLESTLTYQTADGK